jgi:hypothetical protein
LLGLGIFQSLSVFTDTSPIQAFGTWICFCNHGGGREVYGQHIFLFLSEQATLGFQRCSCNYPTSLSTRQRPTSSYPISGFWLTSWWSLFVGLRVSLETSITISKRQSS